VLLQDIIVIWWSRRSPCSLRSVFHSLFSRGTFTTTILLRAIYLLTCFSVRDPVADRRDTPPDDAALITACCWLMRDTFIIITSFPARSVTMRPANPFRALKGTGILSMGCTGKRLTRPHSILVYYICLLRGMLQADPLVGKCERIRGSPSPLTMVCSNYYPDNSPSDVTTVRPGPSARLVSDPHLIDHPVRSSAIPDRSTIPREDWR